MYGKLICKDLNKHYGKGPKVLDNVNLEIPANGIFALIGRNGAGKTTLLRILATELLPSSGTASLNELDVVKNVNALREQIAVVPQEARAISWLTPRQTIASYLLYRGLSVGEANSRVAKSLNKLGIKKYADKLNMLLSGGIKRKVLVATILASEAKILFVDEPTTGLDPVSRAELWAVLNELKKDHFIFLTTHYLEEAERLADLIGILDNGKLVGLGTLDDLRSKVKYQYSVRILEKGFKVKIKKGNKIVSSEGFTQIFTTEEEADQLANKLIKGRTKFAINPITLEDIFYYLVKKPIDEDSEEEEDDEW